MSIGIHGWNLCAQPHAMIRPDWRAKLAPRPQEEWEACGVAEDGALRATAELLYLFDSQGAKAQIHATPEVLSIRGATGIGTAAAVAERVKALALGRSSSEEIAACLGLQADAVEVFLLLWWDVRECLDAVGQISILLDKSQDTDLGEWGRLAYHYGPHILKGLWGMVPMAGAVQEAVEGFKRWQTARRAFIAAATAEDGQGPGFGILRQFFAQKMQDPEKDPTRPGAGGAAGADKGAPPAAHLRKLANMRTDALKRFSYPKGGGRERA